ncbi:MAG: DoxX family protein [Bacteroidota bacterium]
MKMLYWVSTSLLSVALLLSSYTYFFVPSNIEGFKALGYPDHFRVQLGALKVVAAIALIIPAVPGVVKEWAYAGTAFFLLTALVAHLAHRDRIGLTVILLILFGILAVSRYSWSALPH